MLQLRPNCERCDKALPADSPDAMICTFECTFCRDCVDDEFAGLCPNCGGNFERRPIRPLHLLDAYPPKIEQGTTLAMPETEYSVYILRCADDTYYTGIAADVARRIAEHESSPRGAKYLKGRGPLSLVFSAAVGDRSAASRVEYRVKQLHRRDKEALINGLSTLQDLMPVQGSDAG